MPNEHWRRYPPDDQRGWLAELRQRSHELANEVAKLQARTKRLQETVSRLDPNLADDVRRLQAARGPGVGEVVAVVSHTLIVVCLVAAAVVLQVTGNDAALAWGALGGYLGGAGVQKATAPKP